MKSINKPSALKWLMAPILVLTMSVNVLGRISSNGSGGGYGDPGGKAAGSGDTIENYVIAGGIFYLAACSDIDSLLQLYEAQETNGLDSDSFNYYLESVAANMKNAGAQYVKLIAAAETTPYNQTVRNLLITFDYTGFMKENNLIGPVFENVADHLREGDITGIFKRTHSEFTNVSEMLNRMKEKASMGGVPELSLMWRLNETVSVISLEGSYVARIFYAIK